MEMMSRVFLLIASVLAVVFAVFVLYDALLKLGQEAYVPAYIEVPVIVEKWQEAPVEEASVYAPLIEP